MCSPFGTSVHLIPQRTVPSVDADLDKYMQWLLTYEKKNKIIKFIKLGKYE